jgi:hypothetical protein
MFFLENNSSAISYQQSVISYQLTVIRHQLSFISHQSSVISQQSSHQSSVFLRAVNPKKQMSPNTKLHTKKMKKKGRSPCCRPQSYNRCYHRKRLYRAAKYFPFLKEFVSYLSTVIIH